MICIRYKKSGLIFVITMLFMSASGIYGFFIACGHVSRGSMVIDGQPIQVLFAFSAVALIASAFDFRAIFVQTLQGKQKLVRHIWRMGFAMFIAVASFFLGQSQVIPEAIRAIFVLVTPVLLVLCLTIYWAVRVQFWGLAKRT